MHSIQSQKTWEDLIPCFQQPWSLRLTDGFSHPPCKRLHCCSLQTSTLYSFQCSFWGWPAQTWRPSPVLRMGNFRCEPEMEPTEAISRGLWLLSIKGFSRDSLGSVKRGAEQIRSLSTEAFHLPMSMSFTRCSSLHRVLWIKIGAVHMSMHSYSFAMSCLILLVSCCQIL